MDICSEIDSLRDCGFVNCGIVDESLTLKQLALRFELFFEPNIYKEINRQQAAVVVRRILHRDLAYDSKLMSQVKAENLTTRFLDCFDIKDTQYYTNGSYYAPEQGFVNNVKVGHSWTPATYATFDTGILVVSKSKSGCLWVEDED
ncbi:MAG: hypothetical protein AAF316_04425 [Cyanobacteria bacterium P01_A01_bin.80]